MNHHTIPGKADRRWYEPTWGQPLWLLVFGLGFYYFYQQNLLAIAGCFLLLGIAGAIPYREGPGYKIVNDWLKNHLMRKRNDGEVYSTDLADTLYEPDHPKRAPKQMPNVKLVSVPVADKTNAIHQLGLVHTPKNGCDTTYLTSDGWSAAVLSDAPERMMHDTSIAEALKRAANRINAPLTLVMFFVRRPADDNANIRYLARRLHTDISFPQRLTDDSLEQNPIDKAIMDNIQEASDQIYAQGTKLTMGIALRCPRPRNWSKYDLSKLPENVVARSPLFQALNLLSADLHNMGISDVRRLSLFSMNALIRSVFDVADLKKFYNDLAADRDKEERGELGSLDEALTLARGPWPSQIYAHNDSLEADRTHHRIFWITTFDFTEIPPGYFQDLFNIKDIWYQLSYYIETVPGRREYKRAAQKRKNLRKGHELFHPPDKVVESDPRYEASIQEATQQHYALFRSASRGTRTRWMMTVSATSEAQLDLDVEELDAVCRSKGMLMQPYLGESAQTNAMLQSIGILPE